MRFFSYYFMDENKDFETLISKIKVGQPPVDFDFQDNYNKSYRISDLIGKKNIVIYFYPKDFTPGCTIEAEEFSRDYQSFKELDIEIIGISPDSDESHLKFRDKMKIPYMLASDPENEISKNYGVYGLKKFMGKEYLGVNRSTFLVDKSGKVVKVYSKVKPKGHSKEVMEFFKSIK